MMNDVPLTHVALEVGDSVQTLAARHHADIVLDDLNRQCVPRHIAAGIIGAHNAARQAIAQDHAQRRAASAAQHRQQVTQTRARLAARRAPANPDMSALEAMMGADAEAKLDAIGARNEQMRRGVSVGRRLDPDTAAEDQWNR